MDGFFETTIVSLLNDLAHSIDEVVVCHDKVGSNEHINIMLVASDNLVLLVINIVVVDAATVGGPLTLTVCGDQRGTSMGNEVMDTAAVVGVDGAIERGVVEVTFLEFGARPLLRVGGSHRLQVRNQVSVGEAEGTASIFSEER